MENIEKELNNALDLISDENFVEAKAKLENILLYDKNNIEVLKNLGLCEVNLDNPISAIKVFKQVVDLDSNDAVSLFYLANCYNKTGQKEFAITNFKKVIEIRPNYVDAYKNLAMIYIEFTNYPEAIKIINSAIDNEEVEKDYSLYYILATAYMISKDTKNAIKNLEIANELNPGHVQIANSLAISYLNANLIEKVLPVLDSALMANPDNTLTLYNYGVFFQTIKQYKNALEYFKKAYEKEPTSTMLSTLANCAYKAQEYHLSATLYKNLVSAYPNNIMYKISYLDSLEEIEDFNTALQIINSLLQTDPKNIEYTKRKGTYLRKLMRCEQSVEVFNSLLKRGKVDVEIYYNLAFNYVILQDYDNAKDMFKKCIDLEPNNPYAHKDLGVLYLKMNLYDWAVDEMKIAVGLESDVAEFHYSLGVAQMMLSEIDNAKLSFENAIKYDKNFADAYAYLAYIYMLNKDFKEALDILLTALQIDKNNFLAKSHIAKCYFGLEKYDIAKEFLIDILDTTKDDETVNMLGICYMKTNEYEKARNLFLKLIDKYPQNHILYTNIATCEFKLGQNEKALEYVRHALLIFDDYKEALELLEEIKANDK